jgi:hypothetical protein
VHRGHSRRTKALKLGRTKLRRDSVDLHRGGTKAYMQQKSPELRRESVCKIQVRKQGCENPLKELKDEI